MIAERTKQLSCKLPPVLYQIILNDMAKKKTMNFSKYFHKVLQFGLENIKIDAVEKKTEKWPSAVGYISVEFKEELKKAAVKNGLSLNRYVIVLLQKIFKEELEKGVKFYE
jgi:predicted HicB family RNase H-like nuclease